jgi:hypothetical protein
MNEIEAVTRKYDAQYVDRVFSSLEETNKHALTFYKDVAEIYDAVTRCRNVERHPTGFGLDDAPILGLLTRVWKLLKLSLRFYEEQNAEYIGFIERPIIEASVTATYLMTHGSDVIRDYRHCSYKDRLRILRELKKGSPFYDTKAGNRLFASVQGKLAIEDLTEDSFAEQKKNRWRLQGKSFYDIFSEVAHQNLYACVYGMMSETIHGSWSDSMDWDLTPNPDGTFSTHPFFHQPDVRYVSPILEFTTQPYRLWCERIGLTEENSGFVDVLDWVEHFNRALFMKFDAYYDGPPIGKV